MSLNDQVISIGTGIATLSIVGLLSIPTIQSISDRIACRSPRQDEPVLAKTAYRDEDGEATEESLRAFSDKWQRLAIAFFSASGLLVTLALAVVSTIKYGVNDRVLNWLQFGVWVW